MTDPSPPCLPLSPWATLAAEARALAEAAEALADRDPLALAPTAEADPLADLDRRRARIQAQVAECRSATYRALRDRGMTLAQIAARWGVSRQRVSSRTPH